MTWKLQENVTPKLVHSSKLGYEIRTSRKVGEREWRGVHKAKTSRKDLAPKQHTRQEIETQ